MEGRNGILRIEQEYTLISGDEIQDRICHHASPPDVVDFTDNGKCQDCGNCCGNFLPITNAEKATIRRYVKKHNLHPAKPYFVEGPWAKPTVHTECPFLLNTDGHRCMIYSIRPGICRAYTCHDPLHNPEVVRVSLRSTETVNMYIEFFPKETYREAKKKGALNENYKGPRPLR